MSLGRPGSVIALMLVAVVLQVAVTWVLALFVSPFPAGDGLGPRDFATEETIYGEVRTVDHWTSFGGVERMFWHRTSPRDSQLVVQRHWGWPIRSLGVEFDAQTDYGPAGFGHSTTDERTLSVAAGGPESSSNRGRLVPITPLWPGFLVNTFIYFATFALLLLSVQIGLGFVRYCVLGRCPSCGYPLAATSAMTTRVCPECGAERL